MSYVRTNGVDAAPEIQEHGLHLMSHALCPYVQRAVIALHEKGVAYKRTDIDLADKPAWFMDISPLGKTPVLTSRGQPIFESAVILEFLEETQPNPLHPTRPIERAQHRAWMEFGSAILNDIAGFYSAEDEETFTLKTEMLAAKFQRLEDELDEGPYFSGAAFTLVDAVFGPVFRYFDTFERIGTFAILDNKPKVAAWRQALAQRPSVQAAVSPAYPALLERFIERRGGVLSKRLLTSRT